MSRRFCADVAKKNPMSAHVFLCDGSAPRKAQAKSHDALLPAEARTASLVASPGVWGLRCFTPVIFLDLHQNSRHPNVLRPQSGVGERLDHKLGRKRQVSPLE